MSGIARKRTCATTRQDVGDGDAIGEIAGVVVKSLYTTRKIS
jgi:hypothetical protein